MQTIAETIQHTVTIKSSEHAVLNKKNLDKIKQFILKQGQTCTWSNMYNNNPCFRTTGFQFYLNPDPGGPNNHVQWNIDCDPKKGDFNTLVIMPNTQTKQLKSNAKLINADVNFINKNIVEIRYASAQTKSQHKTAIHSSQLAVNDLLVLIKGAK